MAPPRIARGCAGASTDLVSRLCNIFAEKGLLCHLAELGTKALSHPWSLLGYGCSQAEIRTKTQLPPEPALSLLPPPAPAQGCLFGRDGQAMKG